MNQNANDKAAALREAAAAIELAGAASAVAAEANADAAAKGLTALEAERRAMNGLVPLRATPDVVASHNNGSNCNNNGSRNNMVAIAVWAVAIILAVMGLVAWLAYLTAAKADNRRVDAVHALVTTASAENKASTSAAAATANAAAVTANEAKKESANALSVANMANGKADGGVSKADEALKAAQKAVNGMHTHREQPRQAPPVPLTRAPDAELAQHGCKVFDQRNQVLADFLVASKNPKGIVVVTKQECLRERDAFVANNKGWKTLNREDLAN